VLHISGPYLHRSQNFADRFGNNSAALISYYMFLAMCCNEQRRVMAESITPPAAILAAAASWLDTGSTQRFIRAVLSMQQKDATSKTVTVTAYRLAQSDDLETRIWLFEHEGQVMVLKLARTEAAQKSLKKEACVVSALANLYGKGIPFYTGLCAVSGEDAGLGLCSSHGGHTASSFDVLSLTQRCVVDADGPPVLTSMTGDIYCAL
jgi:hypothetical protein